MLGQIDGTSPPAPASEGIFYACTIAGGTYQLNYLYRSDGSSWVERPLKEADLMITTQEFFGGTIEFPGDQVFVWDEDGSEWNSWGAGGNISLDQILTDDVTGQVLVDDVTGNVMAEA